MTTKARNNLPLYLDMYYLKFFHENFSVHFGRPQVDTCNVWEKLNVHKNKVCTFLMNYVELRESGTSCIFK